MPLVAPRVLAAVPAVVVAVLVAAVASIVVDVWLAVLVGVVAGLGTFLLVLWSAPGVALRSLGARPLPEGAEPRLESVVESICATRGIAEPQLYLVESKAPDLAALGRPDEARLVVTTGALRQLDRLELEGVVARQLAATGEGLEAATVLVPVGVLAGPFGGRLRSRVLDERRMAAVDIDAMSVTRYPPALASALEKAAAAGGVPDHAATRHLWLIGPAGTAGSPHPPLTERIDTLREL